MFWPLYSREQSPRHLLNRRLGGAQDQFGSSGGRGEGVNLLPFQESHHDVSDVQPIDLSLYQLMYLSLEVKMYRYVRNKLNFTYLSLTIPNRYTPIGPPALRADNPITG
jgi:hypothetical protein